MPDTAAYIYDLNTALPAQEDGIKDGDNEIRTLKTAIKNSLAGDPDGVYNSGNPDVFDDEGVLAVGPRYLNQLPANFASIINDILLLEASVPTAVEFRAIGSVNGDGTLGDGSVGFTCSKITTGQYRITLSEALASTTKLSFNFGPMPSPPTALTAMYHCYPNIISTTVIDVYTYVADPTTVAAADLRFSVQIIALA